MPDKKIPNVRYRVQLELILDAVATDDAIEIIHSTANIEGSPELTTENGISLLEGAVATIRYQVTRAGKMYEHLSDDAEDSNTLTLRTSQE